MEEMKPREIAIHNAEGKALDVAKRHKNSYVLGVDTIGAYKQHILGKPRDLEDARRILRLLENTTHQVISAICIVETDQSGEVINKKTHAECTHVTFTKMSDEEIENYLASGESMDKAAAFAIQGLGSLFIKKIDGDYFNVVGLPICAMYAVLKEFGEEPI